MNDIFNYLDTIIPNPKCELNYNNDYELLIAVMLSAQTTDIRVNIVTKELFDKYHSLEELRNTNTKAIETIIRPIGTYHKKAINIIEIAKKLKEYNDVVPNNRLFLEKLSGVGRKTTNLVLSILYNVPCIAVDTHIKRVSIRLGLAKKNDDVYTIEKKLTKKIPKDKLLRAHKQLVLFGRYYCKAKKPLCCNCQLKGICKEKSLFSRK